jgi:methylmalonyl-CoA/ethylmalonyl-CoA epimerase
LNLLNQIIKIIQSLNFEIQRIKKEGIRVLNEIPKQGADNQLICFLHPKDTLGVLIELCQEK